MIAVELIPASKGAFEIDVDGTMIFSKLDIGRHAEPGEVVRLFETHVGPRTFEG